MNFKQKIKELGNYLDNTELYIGCRVGAIGGAIAGLVNHSPDYIHRLHSVQNFLELTIVNLRCGAKCLDEILIGILVGTGVGATIKYVHSKKK